MNLLIPDSAKSKTEGKKLSLEKFIFEENTVYGLDLDLKIYKSFSLLGKFNNSFYDIDLDGSVDLIPYLSIGINYKY